jgi:hypothetical protein
MDPKERCETFAHELMHAIGYEYGIEIDHDLIYRHSPAFYVIFRSFPLLLNANAKAENRAKSSAYKAKDERREKKKHDSPQVNHAYS